MFVDLGVRDFLDRAALVHPDRVAVVDEPDPSAGPPSWGALTYRDLHRLARAHAAVLDRLGVPVGARVAVVSHNSARLLLALLSVPAWGRVLVPVNFRLAPPEVERIVVHSGAEVVIVDPTLEHLLEHGAVAGVPHRFVLGRDDEALYGPAGAEPDDPAPWAGDENAAATLNYTSGTTGGPKGVVLTHRALWLNAVLFALHARLTDDDVILHTLPMFHVNGWGMPWAVTGLGGRHVVVRAIDGAEVLRRVQAHGVTLMCAAPAVVASVLAAAAAWEGPVPGRGRVRVVVAGAPPPSRTVERVRAELGWELVQIYGLTETSPLVTVNTVRSEWAGLDAGEQARLLARAGAPALGTRVALAEDGEVLVRSNTVLDRYWENPGATGAALADGWFHTGDGGTLEGGYLTITDRKKDVVITGGENVSSLEVEDVLCHHPAVREAAVIGVPDERWGEAVVAVVVTDGTVTEQELIEHCRASLAGYKRPQRVEFVDALPRTATGKTQKYLLREPFWRGHDRQVG